MNCPINIISTFNLNWEMFDQAGCQLLLTALGISEVNDITSASNPEYIGFSTISIDVRNLGTNDIENKLLGIHPELLFTDEFHTLEQGLFYFFRIEFTQCDCIEENLLENAIYFSGEKCEINLPQSITQKNAKCAARKNSNIFPIPPGTLSDCPNDFEYQVSIPLLGINNTITSINNLAEIDLVAANSECGQSPQTLEFPLTMSGPPSIQEGADEFVFCDECVDQSQTTLGITQCDCNEYSVMIDNTTPVNIASIVFRGGTVNINAAITEANVENIIRPAIENFTGISILDNKSSCFNPNTVYECASCLDRTTTGTGSSFYFTDVVNGGLVVLSPVGGKNDVLYISIRCTEDNNDDRPLRVVLSNGTEINFTERPEGCCTEKVGYWQSFSQSPFTPGALNKIYLQGGDEIVIPVGLSNFSDLSELIVYITNQLITKGAKSLPYVAVLDTSGSAHGYPGSGDGSAGTDPGIGLGVYSWDCPPDACGYTYQLYIYTDVVITGLNVTNGASLTSDEPPQCAIENGDISTKPMTECAVLNKTCPSQACS